MPERKPLIGLTPLMDIERDSLWMLPGYMDGIVQAGGIPVMLPLTDGDDTLRQIAGTYDGFLFTGGQDVCPSLYGEEPLECVTVCPARDRMETKLLRHVLAADRPVLGICRGIQLINAALGGTLFQDLPSQRVSAVPHRQDPPYDLPRHTDRILPDSPLFALLRRESLPVNSCHHQAIRDLSPELREMAVSEDGLIEAVWRPESRFLWAVQWHPEFSFRTNPAGAEIFRAFVESCRLSVSQAQRQNGG